MKQSEKEKATDSKSQHSTKNHVQAFLTSDFKQLFMWLLIFNKYAQLQGMNIYLTFFFILHYS